MSLHIGRPIPWHFRRARASREQGRREFERQHLGSIQAAERIDNARLFANHASFGAACEFWEQHLNDERDTEQPIGAAEWYEDTTDIDRRRK